MDYREVDYLVERANAEFQSAQRAASLLSARPHYSMAVEYLARAEALKRRLRGNAGILTEPK